MRRPVDIEAAAGARSRVLAPLLLAVVATTLALLACEAAARWTMGDAIVLFPRFHAAAQYGPYALRRLEPNARFRHTSVDGRWEFRTNAQGFRDDRDWTVAKPPGELRVLVLGDSHTEGFEARQESTFAAVMERALRQKGLQARVLNAGVSGFGTAEELAYLEHEGIRYAPDVVVVGFSSNDFDDNVKAGLYALRDGELVEVATRHDPGVSVLAVMNAIPGVPWLSQHSYLYSLALNTVWESLKRRLLETSRAQLETEYAVAEGAPDLAVEGPLAVALLARMHAFCRAHGILLVVLDVPQPARLVLHEDTPPAEARDFRSAIPEALQDDFRRDSDVYLPADATLGAWRGIAEVHVPHGQRHVNELAHAALGVAAADAIAARVSAHGGLGVHG